MSKVMLHLQAEGYPESMVRERSMDWILFASEELGKRYRLRLANESVLNQLAVATGMGSEEAGESFQEAVQELRGLEDEDLAYLVNPNAQFDPVAAAQSGMMRPPIKKETSD